MHPQTNHTWAIALFTMCISSHLMAAEMEPALGATTRNQTVTLTTSMEVLDDQRKVGAGDRMSLRIVEDRKPPVELVVTDSIEATEKVTASKKVRIVSCAPLIGEAIRRIANEESVSKLFD